MSEAPAHVGSSEAAAPATAVPATRAAWLRRPLPEWAWYAITLLATGWFVVLALRLWRADLHVPFIFAGDSVFSFVLGREMLDHGWYFTNSRLGAPAGQQLYDFPIGSDTLNLAMLDGWVQISRNAVVGVNLFFISGFFMSAVAAFWALRRMLISRPASAMAAVLFAIVPFHFLRNEGHLFLSAYYAVPLGVFLAVELLQGRPGIASRNRRARLGRLLLCVIIATGGLYYAVFTLVLLSTAALVALTRRERRVVAGAIAAAAVIAGLLVASDVPTLVYDHEHGKAQGVAVRQAFESEFYGQKLAAMVLPMENHRIKALGDLRARYDAADSAHSDVIRAPLGSLPAAGFIALGFILLLGAAGGLPRLSARHPLRVLAVLSAALFIVSTIGGISSLIAYLVTPQVRAWERSTIVFGFFGLAAVALLLDAALRRRGDAWRGMLRVGACGAVLCIGALDQTTNAYISPYSLLGPAWRADENYVRQVESSVPRGSLIYQVPYIGFPEVPLVNRMGPYDPMVGYILSDSLRWSDGAMRGTSADWSVVIASQSLREQLVRVASAGFAGVWVDRYGYADNGASEEAAIAKTARTRPLVASNGRYVFYRLDRLRARLLAAAPAAAVAAVEETVHPLQLSWDNSFYAEETGGKDRWRWSSRPAFEITVDNTAPKARRVTLTATVATALSAAARLTVSLDGRIVKRLILRSGEGTPLKLSLVAPHGSLHLHFVSDVVPAPAGADPRELSVQMVNVSAEPPGADRTVRSLLKAAR